MTHYGGHDGPSHCTEGATEAQRATQPVTNEVRIGTQIFSDHPQAPYTWGALSKVVSGCGTLSWVEEGA